MPVFDQREVDSVGGTEPEPEIRAADRGSAHPRFSVRVSLQLERHRAGQAEAVEETPGMREYLVVGSRLGNRGMAQRARADLAALEACDDLSMIEVERRHENRAIVSRDEALHHERQISMEPARQRGEFGGVVRQGRLESG